MKFNKDLLYHFGIFAIGNPGMNKIRSMPLENSQTSGREKPINIVTKP